jgi:glycosyltransferase involved in cell wall biosynthesis
VKDKPLVSVIAIFLNEGQFLQEAIESVLAQTYDCWELLLVDDGSSDRSTAIAQTYARKHPDKIRYLDHEGHQNLGMSASRNLGIHHARGEYLAFLDGDDVYLPHKLEEQVAILQAHPEAALACGRTQWWYSWAEYEEDSHGVLTHDLKSETEKEKKPPAHDFLQKFNLPLDRAISPPQVLLLFLQDEWASLCDILVRRESVEAVGGYEASFQGMYEDQAFHAKLCLHFPVFVSSQCWYRYRQHPHACTSLSHRLGTTQVARYIFLTWLEKYLTERGSENTEVWHLVQRQLWPFRHPLLSRLSGRIQRLKQKMKALAKPLVRQILSPSLRHGLRRTVDRSSLPVGGVRFGDLRRLSPISREFGFDRGLPIDRYYVERFVSANASDIRGRVLEIGDDVYTWQFGGDRVRRSEVLHVTEGNPKATWIGDLTSADHIPSDSFDCVILAQTLHLIYDMGAAVQTLYRILKPGGVVLATFPGISQSSDDEWGAYWCWSLRTLSARRLFAEAFPEAGIAVEAYGNVLTATAFLQGLATEELHPQELDYRDPHYELLIAVRATKLK